LSLQPNKRYLFAEKVFCRKHKYFFFAIIHPGVEPRCGVNAEALGLISDKELIVKVENNRPYTLLTV